MSQGRVFSLETRSLRYSFDEAGYVIEFTDKASGVNHAKSGCAAFARFPGNGAAGTGITLAGEDMARMEPPAHVEMNGQVITVRFEQAAFTLFAQCFEDHIRMTIVDVSPGDAKFGRFLFAGCEMKEGGMNPDFCGCAVTRSLKGRPLEIPGRCERVGVLAYSALSAQGVSAALIGANPSALREAAKAALTDCTIDDLLISPYGGPWGEEAPGSHEDYMIECVPIDYSTEEWADALRQKNISQLDFHQGIDYRQSDYVFKPEKFPKGASDFRAKVSDVLHKNGMLAGLHTYSSMVDMDSRYVTPVPHPDLYALAEYTLREDMDESSGVILIEEDTDPIPMIQVPSVSVHATVVMIDTELIEFGGKGDKALTDCARACFGTAASGHKKGAKVRHLRNMYNYFQSTPGSALFYELAYNMADAYNTGGFDMMYFDGMECVGCCCTGELEGLGWYYEALFVREVLRTVRRTPLVEYSTFHSAMWGARSRAGAWDAVTSGFTTFMRAHFESNERVGHRRMLPCTLGWWEMYPPIREPEGTRPNWRAKAEYSDDVDYLGSKSIGLNSGLSYLSVPDSTAADRQAVRYPQYMRLFDRVARYSRLREKRYFSEEVCRRLSDLSVNHRLIEKNGEYGFVEQTRLYGRAYALKEGENTVRINNPYGEQRPFLRLIAQCAAAKAEGRVIAHFDREKPVSEQAKDFRFDSPLDIAGREALGVWVRGVGKDEYLNIRLECVPPQPKAYGEHVVHLNFEGWRFCMLCENDNGDYNELRYRSEEQEGESGLYKRYREAVRYESIDQMHILCTGDLSEVYMGDVCAYPVDDTPVVNPSVCANGSEITFDAELAPGSYIEYAPGENEAIVYDIHGHTQNIRAMGDAPLLKPGINEVCLGGQAEGSHRLKLHMIVDGGEIFNGIKG